MRQSSSKHVGAEIGPAITLALASRLHPAQILAHAGSSGISPIQQVLKRAKRVRWAHRSPCSRAARPAAVRLSAEALTSVCRIFAFDPPTTGLAGVHSILVLPDSVLVQCE